MPVTLDTEWSAEGKVYTRTFEDGTHGGIAQASSYGLGVKVRFFDAHHEEAKSLLALNEDGFFYCSKWDTADYVVLAVAEEAEKGEAK